MEAVRLHKVIEKDGELVITNLPCKKGEQVGVIVLTEPPDTSKPPRLTANRLLESGLVGLWQDRQDITDSAAYARHLREEAQRRQR